MRSLNPQLLEHFNHDMLKESEDRNDEITNHSLYKSTYKSEGDRQDGTGLKDSERSNNSSQGS